jgi:hypothetical protein
MAHVQSQMLPLVNVVNKLYGQQLAVKTFTYFGKTLTTRYLIHEEIENTTDCVITQKTVVLKLRGD